MLVSIIVAVSENGIIGKDNQLLWRLSNDLKRFKKLTLGHPIIMGRKTFDSIGKPLPGRTSIVISRSKKEFPEGVIRVGSLEEAIEKAKKIDKEEAFVIGGGEIYRLAESVADAIYLTKVHTTIEGDTSFAISNLEDWQETHREFAKADERHDFDYTFIDYQRK